MKQKVWETGEYYKKAHEGSLDFRHSGMELLLKISTGKKAVLDLGCGDGTRLSKVSKNGTGIDISAIAIKKAKTRYPKGKFLVGDLTNLPFADNTFDLIYSAYVFEHLENPEKVISEARRVLKKDSDFVIICPNYGAPNRSSPPFRGSRIKKFFSGFLNDFAILFGRLNKLNWNKVNPIARVGGYESDWDVTIEPYSLSLEKYLSVNGFRVIKNIPVWNYELKEAKGHQKIFKFLSGLGIYPFTYWSPHIVIQARKF